MNEKLLKILQEVKNGERKSTYGIDITLDEYLSKDSDGISFLEHLLMLDFDINYKDTEKLKNSVEAGYLYCKYDKSMYQFEFSEKDLFSVLNGQRFIDFLVQKDKLSSKIIKSIKENIEIVDIVISVNKWNCDSFSPEIVKKLMIADSNGKYPIEKYFDDSDVTKFLFKLIDNPEIIQLCKKNNKYNLLKDASVEVLLSKVNEKDTLLDELLNNNITPTLLTRIPWDMTFINYLREKNLYQYLQNVSEDILLTKVDKEKTILEEIIEKGYKPKLSYLFEPKTINILYNTNKLHLISSVSENLLLTPVENVINGVMHENKTLLEYLLDNGINPLSETFSIKSKSIIKIFFDKGYYDFLGEKVGEDLLFCEIDDICLIDKLLDNNVNLNFDLGSFKLEKTAAKLVEKNRFDLLAKGNLNILLNFVDSDKTYLDYFLKNFKEKKINCNLRSINLYNCSVNDIARFYLMLAKYDLIKYMENLTQDDLLKDYSGKTLLDELLDLDSKLTLDKIISDKTKSKLEIALILKSRGLEQKNIDVPLENNNYSKEYLDSVERHSGIGPLLSEGEILLNKLNNLFLSDGESDHDLVSALISGYRNSLLTNYDLNIQELRNLVEVKEKNMEKFIYIKQDEGAFFRAHTGAVHCDNTVIDTLLHETGHALHYYLAENKVPENYNTVIENIRMNPDNLIKVEEFTNRYNDIRNHIKSDVEGKYKFFFDAYFNSERIEQIKSFLDTSVLEKKSKFMSLGIPEENLDIILNNSFTVEEYISHQKRTFINEYTDAIMRSEYGNYMAISDILDAIYLGELHSSFLKNEKGEKIKGTAGHGVSYYYNTSHGFDEMVANFASLVKSNKSEEMLNLLKYVVGDELYNILSEFYYNNIVISKTEQLESSKSL